MYENKNLKKVQVNILRLPKYMDLPSPICVEDEDPLSIHLYAGIAGWCIPFLPNTTMKIPTGLVVFMPRGVEAAVTMHQDAQLGRPASAPHCGDDFIQLEEDVKLYSDIVLTLRNNDTYTHEIKRGMRLATLKLPTHCRVQILEDTRRPLTAHSI